MTEETQTATAVAEPQGSDTPAPRIPDPKDMSPEEIQDWNTNPKWADKYFKKSKADESQESSTAENTSEQPHEAEQVQKKAKTAEDRKVQLTNQIQEKAREKKALESEVEALKAQRDSLKQPQPQQSSKSAVNTAPVAETINQENGKPVAPKQADFMEFEDAWEQYTAAKDKYQEDLAEWKAEQKIQQYEGRKAYASKWTSRINEAMELFPDFVQVAKPMAEYIQKSPTLNRFLEKHKDAAKVIYRLGENAAAEAERITAISDPDDQLVELYEIAAEFKGTPKSQPEPVKQRISRAPAPTRNLATDSATGDPITAASMAGNQEEYEALMNAEERKRRSGR